MLDDGLEVVARGHSRIIWNYWQDFWKWVYERLDGQPFVLVHNGDAVDTFINQVQSLRVNQILLDLASHVEDIAQVRRLNGKKLNAADPSQKISAKELGLKDRRLHWLRVYLEPVGTLESLMFNYANALAAVPKEERPNVPFVSEAQHAALIRSFGQAGNIVRETNSPGSYRGSFLRKTFGTLASYPANMLDQIIKAVPRHNDPKVMAQLLNLMGAVATLGTLGVILKELRAPVQQAITGKDPGQPLLANVLDNPVSLDGARYMAGAMGAMIPYLNLATDQVFGGGSGKTMFDLTSTVPLLGWWADLTRMGKEAMLSGDFAKFAYDYSNRYLPLYSGVVNRLPGPAAYVELQNAQRALRAANPVGEIEMREVSGGSANPTPVSRYLRSAEVAMYRGDVGAAKTAINQAVDWKMSNTPGLTRQKAMQSVTQSLAGRNPQARVYGRKLSPADEERVLGRMTDWQRRAYDRGMQAGRQLKALAGGTPAGMQPASILRQGKPKPLLRQPRKLRSLMR
jgi:hypothetical protein